jgi:hypothetical protein
VHLEESDMHSDNLKKGWSDKTVCMVQAAKGGWSKAVVVETAHKEGVDADERGAKRPRTQL